MTPNVKTSTSRFHYEKKLKNYLTQGDQVQWKGKTKENIAFYDEAEDALVAIFNSEPMIFSSPSAFAQHCAWWQKNWEGSKPSVSGWERCKVLREGSWIKLNVLVSSKKKKYILKTSNKNSDFALLYRR